ncbi:hypothetical protein FRC11_014660, partial [Ceratobasidium sp. 423]
CASHDPTSKPEPEVKQPAKAKSTSSKACHKVSLLTCSHSPSPGRDQSDSQGDQPDPELFKQKCACCPKTPSSEPKINEDDEDDGNEYQLSSKSNHPKKRTTQCSEHSSEVDELKQDESEDEPEPECKPPKSSCQDKSPLASNPAPEVEKVVSTKKGALKSALKLTSAKSHTCKTSEETAPPLELMIIM